MSEIRPIPTGTCIVQWHLLKNQHVLSTLKVIKIGIGVLIVWAASQVLECRALLDQRQAIMFATTVGICVVKSVVVVFTQGVIAPRASNRSMDAVLIGR